MSWILLVQLFYKSYRVRASASILTHKLKELYGDDGEAPANEQNGIRSFDCGI